MNPLYFFRGFYLPDGVVVSGNFTSEKGMSVSGIINGNLKVKSGIVIEKKGIINGDLHGENILVKGKVNGNIYCKGKIITMKGATVTGNIFAAESKIDKLSVIKGVLSHINQAKENKNNPENNGKTDAAKSNEIKLSASKKNLIHSETEDTPILDKPPQNWF